MISTHRTLDESHGPDGPHYLLNYSMSSLSVRFRATGWIATDIPVYQELAKRVAVFNSIGTATGLRGTNLDGGNRGLLWVKTLSIRVPI